MSINAKKLLLVDPTYNPGNIPPNLGMGKIESNLAHHNIDIKVCDFVHNHHNGLSLSQFRALENSFRESVVENALKSDVMYISGSHGMELKPYAMFPRISDVTMAAKKANPKLHIVFGGALATFYTKIHQIPETAFKEFGIDTVVSGQEQNADKVILNALGLNNQSLITLRKRDWVNGRSNNELITWNSWNLDKYPDYLSLMIQTGCPHTCSFCFEGHVFDPKRPQATPTDIKETVLNLKNKMPVNGIMIEDSVAVTFPWFDDLSKQLKESDVPWSIYARVNEIVNNPERITQMVESGCHSAIVGIESLQDSNLIATNKKTNVNQNVEALRIAENAGLNVQGCFILGFPTDTISECVSRVEAAKQFNLSTYRWHIMQPDWSSLPKDIKGFDQFSVNDHFNAQVSVPDSCLAELIEQENAHPVLIYDEHVLIRLISEGYDNFKALSDYGYHGKFRLSELMEEVSPIIKDIGKPTNEDEMYKELFGIRRSYD